MRFIVTGALGHIGSKLIRSLPATFPGTQIVMIDNLMTQRYCSLFNLPENGYYNFIEDDILKMDLEAFLQADDVVIHLAAITDATSSLDRQQEVEEVNYVGTEKIAKACAAKNAKLIFLSTTSVYGTKNDQVDENCLPDEIQPQSPYSLSKFKAEGMLRDLRKEKDFKYVICRFGTIFGTSAGMRFHTAVNKFCWQAVMKIPLTVWSTAYNQRRPYLDLNDAVRALEFIIEKNLFNQEIYNIVSINAAVKDITDSIKNEVPELSLNFVDSKLMNQLSYDVLSDKFKACGFEFRSDLKESIKDTITLLKKANS